MSTSHEFLGFPARRAPEKSKFSRTCSLLSQYLKENGNFGALSFGIASDLAGKGNLETMRPATTLDLLPKIEMPKEDSPMKESASEQRKTWTGMLSQRVGSGTGTSAPVEEVANSKDIDLRSGSEEGSSQMTIFYAGKVLVFDNLPASKAKELMLLASKGTSQNILPISLPSNGSTTNSSAYDHPATLPQQQNHKAASISGINSPLDNLRQSTPVEGFANSNHKTYMPIARKASLHRFLEKRKDRVNSKAPYQVNQASSSQREPEETNSWLGLFPQSN